MDMSLGRQLGRKHKTPLFSWQFAHDDRDVFQASGDVCAQGA